MNQAFSRRLPSPITVLLLTMAASAMAQPVSAPKIEVRSFKVSGNSLLSSAQVDAVLDGYKGERNFDELKQAAAALQARYRKAGYGAVIAFLPAQAPAGSEVAITVIEGRIGNVTVAGQKHFTEANVRASLPSLVVGQTPHVRDIDAQIQLANENPVKRIEVLLQPGQKPGEVDASIQVSDQAPSRFSIGLDNSGNSSTGRLRANFGYQNAALWDRDHVLTLQLQVAPEELQSLAVVGANYRIPLYAEGMALDGYAAYSDADGGTTATAAGPLQFSGRSRVLGLRVTKYLPRFGEIDHRLIAGLDSRDYINNCNIVGLPAGACGGVGESVSVQPLALEYVVQKGGENRYGGSIGLLHNLNMGGGNSDASQFQKVRPGSKPRYTVLRFGLFAAFALPEDWQLQGRLIGQSSADPLVPGEQFGVGGASSVRGYGEREIVGDSGVVAGVEVTSPDFAKSVGLNSGSLRALGFVDAGWVKNQLSTPCRLTESKCQLSSVGVGVRYGSGPVEARLDVAYALDAGNRTSRHSARTHFSVIYSF